MGRLAARRPALGGRRGRAGRRLGRGASRVVAALLPRCRRAQRLRRRRVARTWRRPRAPRAVVREHRGRRDLDGPDRRLPGERSEPRAPREVRVPRRRHAGAARKAGRRLARRRSPRTGRRGDHMKKVEAVVIRERVETVMDAVEAETGHVGVTVVEAIGHGRQRGVTHEYRGRVFESRFLPKALLTFVVEDSLAQAVVTAVADAARSGHESGDGIVWTTPIENATHNRTGLPLAEVEVA